MDQIFFQSQKMLFLDVFPLKISKKYFFQSFLKNSWNKGLNLDASIDSNLLLSTFDTVFIHLLYGNAKLLLFYLYVNIQKKKKKKKKNRDKKFINVFEKSFWIQIYHVILKISSSS